MIAQADKGTAAAVQADPEEALPKALTTPYFSQGFKEVLTSFVQKLLKEGVPRDKLNKALSEMAPEIQRVAKSSNAAFSVQVSKYLARRKWEEMRQDYLGRALLFEIEPFFPHDEETNEKLQLEPIEGLVPHQVAEGLIMALKQAHGTELIHQYEELCTVRKERYRNEVTRLIDVNSFIGDPEIRQVVKDITTRFRLLLHKKTEPEQRKWLLNLISRSHAFKEMKRDLTDRELDIIAKAFLKASHA